MPAASCSGLSATTICIVVQFGLATIPWFCAIASGLTSETTSGTSGSMRHCEELSITIAPALAKRGAHSFEVAEPAENRATSKPAIASSLSACTTRPAPAPSSVRPAERSEAKGTSSDGRETAILEDAQDLLSDDAGGADDGDAMAHAAPFGANGCSESVVPAPSSNASCSDRTAVGDPVALDDAGDLDRRRRDHLDVDALATENGKHLRRDTGMRAHASTDDRHLAHLRMLGESGAHLLDEAGEGVAGDAQVVLGHGEGDLRAAAVRVGIVLHDHVDVDVRVGERGEHAPGGARLVGHADERERGPRRSNG